MRANTIETINERESIIRSPATGAAIIGAFIAGVGIVAAILLSAYFEYGQISLKSVVDIQKSNHVIWILYTTPFAFALWGQYVRNSVSRQVTREATNLLNTKTRHFSRLTRDLEHKIWVRETRDDLTGLLNRNSYRDQLRKRIQAAQRSNQSFALISLDLDRFKEVNQILGQFCGDQLLVQVAKRLTSIVEDTLSLSRPGGDEFSMIITDISDRNSLSKIVTKIENALKESFTVAEIPIEVQASIGVAQFPQHGKTTDTLLKNAELAMYAAKSSKSGHAVYDQEKMGHGKPRQLVIASRLREAIEKNRIDVYYQPQIDASTGKICGTEALARWQDTELGSIKPDEFIPIAEQTGSIRELTYQVIKKAVAQIEHWHRQGNPLSVSVNLSAQVLEDIHLLDNIRSILSTISIPASKLILEVTESTMMNNAERSLNTLKQLAALDIQISIDDFGTGYSSLAYLKRLPAQELKIDKSFVLDMLNDPSDATIVKTTINLAHDLGLKVVAEGVANEFINEELIRLGCDYLQGFYISKALPKEEFVDFTHQWNTTLMTKTKNPKVQSIHPIGLRPVQTSF